MSVLSLLATAHWLQRHVSSASEVALAVSHGIRAYKQGDSQRERQLGREGSATSLAFRSATLSRQQRTNGRRSSAGLS